MINIHFSDDSNNFRNVKYLDSMEEEFKKMFRAYHKFMSYRSKLISELTMDELQHNRMLDIETRFVRNLTRAANRIQKEDFKRE